MTKDGAQRDHEGRQQEVHPPDRRVGGASGDGGSGGPPGNRDVLGDESSSGGLHLFCLLGVGLATRALARGLRPRQQEPKAEFKELSSITWNVTFAISGVQVTVGLAWVPLTIDEAGAPLEEVDLTTQPAMLSSRPISFNDDVDVPQSILNAKTPGRKALKGRTALQENALHAGPKTVFSKKSVIQTPFRPGTAHGKKPLVSISVTRPLMDKTPFPNRVAAANFAGAGPAGKTPGTKLSKLALLVSEPQQESLSPDVAPLLRPSSARKSLRGRLSGSTFKTPLTKGNYWDVSPGDMEGIGGVAEDAKEETEVAVDDEEDDEIEYMPPTAVELPYEPLFEIPDYKAMGQALFALGHGDLMDDTADAYYAMDIEQQIDMKQLLADAGLKPDSRGDDGLQLPELEDDSPFARKPTPATAAAAPVSQSQSQARSQSRPQASKFASSIPLTRTSSRTQPAPPARPATTTTTPPTQTQSRPASTSSASSSSSRVPQVQPTIVVAPGQTRTSALRAAKAAAAAAGASAPKSNSNSNSGIARRPAASAAVSSSSNINAAATPAGTRTNTMPKSKSKTQAQAPPQGQGQGQGQVQSRVQAQAQAQARPITRSATRGAVAANAGAGTGRGAGVSAGTGTGAMGSRSRAASVNANMLGKTRALAGTSASGAKGAGARGGKADRYGDGDGDGDELASALEKGAADVGEDFVFELGL